MAESRHSTPSMGDWCAPNLTSRAPDYLRAARVLGFPEGAFDDSKVSFELAYDLGLVARRGCVEVIANAVVQRAAVLYSFDASPVDSPAVQF